MVFKDATMSVLKPAVCVVVRLANWLPISPVTLAVSKLFSFVAFNAESCWVVNEPSAVLFKPNNCSFVRLLTCAVVKACCCTLLKARN